MGEPVLLIPADGPRWGRASFDGRRRRRRRCCSPQCVSALAGASHMAGDIQAYVAGKYGLADCTQAAQVEEGTMWNSVCCAIAAAGQCRGCPDRCKCVSDVCKWGWSAQGRVCMGEGCQLSQAIAPNWLPRCAASRPQSVLSCITSNMAALTAAVARPLLCGALLPRSWPRPAAAAARSPAARAGHRRVCTRAAAKPDDEVRGNGGSAAAARRLPPAASRLASATAPSFLPYRWSPSPRRCCQCLAARRSSRRSRLGERGW